MITRPALRPRRKILSDDRQTVRQTLHPRTPNPLAAHLLRHPRVRHQALLRPPRHPAAGLALALPVLRFARAPRRQPRRARHYERVGHRALAQGVRAVRRGRPVPDAVHPPPAPAAPGPSRGPGASAARSCGSRSRTARRAAPTTPSRTRRAHRAPPPPPPPPPPREAAAPFRRAVAPRGLGLLGRDRERRRRLELRAWLRGRWPAAPAAHSVCDEHGALGALGFRVVPDGAFGRELRVGAGDAGAVDEDAGVDARGTVVGWPGDGRRGEAALFEVPPVPGQCFPSRADGACAVHQKAKE